jgi:hypothetical protein
MADKITLLRGELFSRGLSLPALSDSYTSNNFIMDACGALHMNPQTLTDFLWNKYEPYSIWMIFLGIGLVTVAGLLIYDRWIVGSKRV